MKTRITFIAASLVCAGALIAAQSAFTKESVPGIVNFATVEKTVSCTT